MRCHEENTPTTTRWLQQKLQLQLRIKNGYYGKKDWNKNTKSSYQKKDDKKESKDKDVYLTLTKRRQIPLSCRIPMKIYLPVHAE